MKKAEPRRLQSKPRFPVLEFELFKKPAQFLELNDLGVERSRPVYVQAKPEKPRLAPTASRRKNRSKCFQDQNCVSRWML